MDLADAVIWTFLPNALRSRDRPANGILATTKKSLDKFFRFKSNPVNSLMVCRNTINEALGRFARA